MAPNDIENMYPMTVRTRKKRLLGLGSYNSSMASGLLMEGAPPEAAELSLAAQLTGYLISFEWPRMPFIILLPAMAAPIWDEPGFGRFEKHQQRSTASRLICCSR